MQRVLTLALVAVMGCAVLASPAAADTRLATIVGVSGTLTSSFRYEADARTDVGPVQDACLVLSEDATYRFSLAKGGEVVEVDFGMPALIRPAIETVRGGTRIRIRASATGTAQATGGLYSAFQDCEVETPGYSEGGLATPTAGISPRRCATRTGTFVLDQQGPDFGSLSELKLGWEDAWINCGWTMHTQLVPTIIASGLRGNWAAKRTAFLRGPAGTTVTVTYPLTIKPDDPSCPGSSNDVVIRVCTISQSGALTVRYRLGS